VLIILLFLDAAVLLGFGMYAFVVGGFCLVIVYDKQYFGIFMLYRIIAGCLYVFLNTVILIFLKLYD
jgi:hypothetical protein